MRTLECKELAEVQGGMVVDLSMDFDGFIHLDVRLSPEEAFQGGGVILLTGDDTNRDDQQDPLPA